MLARRRCKHRRFLGDCLTSWDGSDHVAAKHEWSHHQFSMLLVVINTKPAPALRHVDKDDHAHLDAVRHPSPFPLSLHANPSLESPDKSACPITWRWFCSQTSCVIPERVRQGAKDAFCISVYLQGIPRQNLPSWAQSRSDLLAGSAHAARMVPVRCAATTRSSWC